MPRTSRKASAVTARSTWAPTGTLTIDTVSEQWQTLRPRLQDASETQADLGGITRVDTAGIQLLLQAQRTAAGAGHTFHVTGVPMSSEARALLGITDDAAVAATTPAGRAGQEG
ncbi:STAS domain-containing protein [Luteitalea sp.]|uniref:STAS domain-containing protein n=1 Tax=Luteitalea sp. TaxID=2004800 RepID=UPI0025C31940|nr:STAS domain-containing protein [Luteitalea sp.]